MKAYRTEQLRNVGLFSHGGAGKTSIAEAMLFCAGAIGRLGRVEDGTTVSDYDPEEVRRHISVQLALLPLEWRNTKINLVDTPGYADFVGEVHEAVRAVDSAIVVFEAVAGVEVGTETVWQQADNHGLPRLVLINKMDRENANFERTLEQMVSRFGKRLVPIQLPIGAESTFDGVVDLLTMKAYRGADLIESEIPAELRTRAEQARESLVEAAAETDDELIAKYLEGEALSDDEIRTGLRAGVLSGQVVPVLCCAALTNKAVAPVLDAIANYLPSPADRPGVEATNLVTQKPEVLKPGDDQPLAALVFKTTADPFVGKLTYFRVFSGVMHSDSTVWNAAKGREERLGQLFVIRGKSQEPIVQLGAGEIGAVAKLQETSTGDTLCYKDHPVALEAISFPEPVLSVAVAPKTKADLDKLGNALTRLVDEDPTLQVRKDPDTGETIVSGLGESHVEIAAEKMRRKFGVDVTLSIPRVPYKETITIPSKAEYKHKKQTGGHGQYGHVLIELEPTERGAGFEFAERVVGGAVPRNFIPAVEKGVREVLTEGNLAGYPVVDVKVTLYDGSSHSVDSSEMAFKIAAAQAFKKGFDLGRPVLIEPIMNVTVTVPEQYVGDVMGDLNTKRARVMGINPQGGLTVIEAQAPLAEMQRYATDLRSLTQGRGTYRMEFSHHEEVPAHIAQQVIAEAKREKAEAK